jgi:hypothetical protein
MIRTVGRVLIAVAALGAAVHAATFKSTWKAPDAGTVGFAGKKVIALVIDKDQDLRVSAEEALVRALAPYGVQGVAAYRLIPREELQDTDKAKGWFERAGAEGVVAMRVAGTDRKLTYTPDMWTASYYGSWWGYYGYGWTTALGTGTVREDTVVAVETLVFSVTRDKLLWAGMSETTNPKSAEALIKRLVDEAVKEMKKEGLTRKAPG